MNEINFTNLEITQLAAPLQLGEQLAGQVCPECRGGSSQERSFSLSRAEDGVLYICHRASCGFRGYLELQDNGEVRSLHLRPPKTRAPRPYEKTLVPLPEDYVRYFQKHFELSADELKTRRVLYAPDDEAVYFSCRSVLGTTLGGVTRVYFGPNKKRIRTYSVTPQSIYSHYRADNSEFPETCYLVEDCVSAMKLAKFCNTVALLGTNIPMSLIYDLRIRYKRIVIALDPDMRPLTVTHRKHLSLFFSDVAVEFFDRDPKDTTVLELEKLHG